MSLYRIKGLPEDNTYDLPDDPPPPAHYVRVDARRTNKAAHKPAVTSDTPSAAAQTKES